MSESDRGEIAKLEALYSANPGGRIFTHLAEAYRRAGELDRARAVVEDGLVRHAEYPSAHVVHGRVLTDLGDAYAAEAAFGRVLELDPENRVALRALGDLAWGAERVGEALERYRALHLLDPGDEEVESLVRMAEAASGEAAGGAETPGDPARVTDLGGSEAEAGVGEWEGGGIETLEAGADSPGVLDDADVVDLTDELAASSFEDEPFDAVDDVDAIDDPAAADAPGASVDMGDFGLDTSGLDDLGLESHDVDDSGFDDALLDVGDLGLEDDALAGHESDAAPMDDLMSLDIEHTSEPDAESAIEPIAGLEMDMHGESVDIAPAPGLEQPLDPDAAGDVGAVPGLEAFDSFEIESFETADLSEPLEGEPAADAEDVVTAEEPVAEEEPVAAEEWISLEEPAAAEDPVALEEEPVALEEPVAADVEFAVDEVAATDDVASDVRGAFAAFEEPPDETDGATGHAFEADGFADETGAAAELELDEADAVAAEPAELELGESDIAAAEPVEMELDETDVVFVETAAPEAVESEGVVAEPAELELGAADVVASEPAELELGAADVVAAEPAELELGAADVVAAEPAELELGAAYGGTGATSGPGDLESAREGDVPVVTETMAELYARQGLHGQAAAMYKELLRHRPDDARLRARLAEAEEQAASAAGLGLGVGGPTIGEYLRELLRYDPGPVSRGTAALSSAGSGTADELSGAESIEAATETAATSADDFAVLAEATAAPESGEPDEYDLLFGTGEAAPADAADSAGSAEAGPSVPEHAPPDEDDDDVEMFRAWLQNLKR